MRRRLRIALLVLIGLWFVTALPFIAAGPLAFLIVPVSLAMQPEVLYQRGIAEPAFRRAVRVGATRESIRRAGNRWSGDVVVQQGADAPIIATFTTFAVFCAATEDVWTVQFDDEAQVKTWDVESRGSGC